MNNLKNNTKGLIGALALIITIVVGGGSIVLGTGALDNINKQGCGNAYKAWRNGDIYARLADADDEQALIDAERCRKTIIKTVKAAGPVASLMSASGNLGGGSTLKDALTKIDTVILDRIMDYIDKASDPENESPAISAIFPPDVIEKWDEYFKKVYFGEVEFAIKPLVVGSVKSKTTGEPIKGAEVKLTLWDIKDVHSDDKTDEEGKYFLEEIAEGYYKLIMEAENYEPLTYTIFIEGVVVKVQGGEALGIVLNRALGPDEYLTIDAELEDKMIELNGEVIDAKEGDGISGASIDYSDSNANHFSADVKTDSGGNFTLKVPMDTEGYKIKASATNYKGATANATGFSGIIKLEPVEPVPEPEPVTEPEEEGHHDGEGEGGVIDTGPANAYESENQEAAILCCGMKGGVIGFVVEGGRMIKDCNGVDLFTFYEKNCK